MNERHEMFDEMLDECYPTIEIAGITFYPSDILAECDPIAYRVALHDWQDAQCADGLHFFLPDSIYCDSCGDAGEEVEA